MKKLNVSAAPHIHSGISTNNIMLDVVIAMIPASIVAVLFFGLKALLLILTCIASAVISELLFNLAVKKQQTVGDFSAVVTGLILALNLSTNVKLWQAALGSIFAIVVVKCIFGGLGKNIVNPAIAARVLLLLTFATVAGGAAISPLFDLGFLGNAVPAPELVGSATPLVDLNQGVEAAQNAPTILQLLVGAYGGTIGETSAIAILLGFAYLVAKKVIRWYVPVSFIATVFVCYFLFTFDATYALQQVLAGGLLFGAVFMATDYVTTPATNKGRIVFCIGCGLLTFYIRQFGSFPEGVSISILVMNILTPLLEKITANRTLGGVK